MLVVVVFNPSSHDFREDPQLTQRTHQGDSFAGYMGKTGKSGTVGAFDKAGNVETICIIFWDVVPTAEKLYRFGPCWSSPPRWA